MVYTCAYFPEPDGALEAAQIAKMDLVCRKLGLRPGERVIEAGCGWGSLALFMAREYGVTVRAFNISAEQIAYARDRAQAERLVDRVEFVEGDYREVRGECDAFVSLGMLEHVGLADYPTLGGVIDRSLTDQGRGLLHFIGRNRPGPLNPWIRKRIFPGAYPPILAEVFGNVLEPWDLSVLDVENLRLHYAATLAHWRRRFDAAADEVAGMFDDAFVRAWRLYLAGSQAAFVTGTMQLFQVVFARGGEQRDSVDSTPPRRSGRAMDSCDALIVGGGPAGSTCAWKLRQAGLDVMVMDAAVFPRDKLCAGWITPPVVAELDLDPEAYRQGASDPGSPGGRTLQPITGFRVGLIGGRDEIETGYGRPVSFGIRRCEFDHYLLQRSGARLRLGHAVTQPAIGRRPMDRQRRHPDADAGRGRRSLLSGVAMDQRSHQHGAVGGGAGGGVPHRCTAIERRSRSRVRRRSCTSAAI